MDIDKANQLLGRAITCLQDSEVDELSGRFRDIEDPHLVAYEEEITGKKIIECLDCGARFRKKIRSDFPEIKCPKCNSFDTEIA